MQVVGTFYDKENGHTDRIKGGCIRDDGDGWQFVYTAAYD